MTNLCTTVRESLARYERCDETTQGSRFETHCLYPSFEPVAVYVVKIGDGFLVHDGGGAHACSWAHGRDEKLISRALAESAGRFGLRTDNRQIVSDIPSEAWLASGILSVANASAGAALDAVSRQAKAASDRLHERVREVLIRRFTIARVSEDIVRTGESGRDYHFDFGVRDGTRSVVIDVVTPARGSIVHKYTAFADAKVRYQGGAFAVHDLPLVPADANLLAQVADVVPYVALPAGVERALLH